MTHLLGLNSKKVFQMVSMLSSDPSRSKVKKKGLNYSFQVDKVRQGSRQVMVMMGNKIRVTEAEFGNASAGNGITHCIKSDDVNREDKKHSNGGRDSPVDEMWGDNAMQSASDKWWEMSVYPQSASQLASASLSQSQIVSASGSQSPYSTRSSSPSTVLDYASQQRLHLIRVYVRQVCVAGIEIEIDCCVFIKILVFVV
jgi:hypothetical protein